MRRLALISLLLFSCTPQTDTGLFAPQDLGTDLEEIADVADQDGVEQLQKSTLTGYWAKMDQLSTCVMVLNAGIESFSWNLALFKMEEMWRTLDGKVAWVRVTAPICRKTMTPIVLTLAANVPTKVLDTMEAPVFECMVRAPEGKTLPAEGDFSLQGLTFSCPLWTETWGVHFEDPFTDPLPTTKEDPRVFDQDGDGKPGVTLILGDNMCEILVVQRSVSLFEGIFSSDDMLTAPFESLVNQKVLEGTQGLCGTENESFSNPARSKVYLMRADGYGGSFDADADQDGAVTCEDLRTKAEEMYQKYGVVADETDNTVCKPAE